MTKILKIAIVIILIVAVGFFLYQQLSKPDGTDADIEAMKKVILADPVVQAANLTPEQKAKFIEQFKRAREESAKANLDTLQGLNEMAQLKMTLGDLEGARVTWEYANLIRPKNSLSFANLAALYHFDLKQYEKAEKNYLIAIANDPDDLPTIRNFFELYFYSLKDYAKAEGLILKSIQDNPTILDLYALAGTLYTELGKLDQAIEYYQKNLDLNPKNEAVKAEIKRLKELQGQIP